MSALSHARFRHAATTTIVVAVAIATGLGCGSDPAARAEAAGGRPNIVVIMTDDQTVGDMAGMPRTRALIGGAGVTLRPLVRLLSALLPVARDLPHRPVRAQPRRAAASTRRTGGYGALRHARTRCRSGCSDAGYDTAHIGKYLNGYGDAGARRRAAGLDRLARRVDNSHLPDVGLHDQRERPHAHLRRAVRRGPARSTRPTCCARRRVDHRRASAGAASRSSCR